MDKFHPTIQLVIGISTLSSIKTAGKPATAVFLFREPATAGFSKGQDCPQPSDYMRSVILWDKFFDLSLYSG